METLIVVLIVLIVVLLFGGGVFLLRPSRKQNEDEVRIDDSSIVTVRNAPTKNVVIRFVDDMSAEAALPFNWDYEREAFKERTAIEVFLDPSTPESQKEALADQLSQLGYKFPELMKRGYVPKAPAAPAQQAPVEDGDDDIARIVDMDVLLQKLSSPYLDEARRNRIHERIKELGARAGGEAGGAGDDGKGDSADSGSEDDSEPDAERKGDNEVIEGQVDPDTKESVPESSRYVDERSSDDILADMINESEDADKVKLLQDSGFQLSEVGEPTTPEESPVFEFRFDHDVNDDEDSRKTVALMVFIATSFKEGNISPELVMFAQEKLHLEVVKGLWDEESLKRGNARKVVYNNSRYLDMSLDDFSMYVHNVVHSSKRNSPGKGEGEKDNGASVASGSGSASEKPAPVRVTTSIDIHGGKDDLVWRRLERMSEFI